MKFSAFDIAMNTSSVTRSGTPYQKVKTFCYTQIMVDGIYFKALSSDTI